ncbi:hypothetical protein ACH36K_17415 [Clostridium sp. MB05]|uniref:hypothetical protein n=1 Tax=Clostridium sp. MB05 TaxID=3376682 RepID=UPI003981FB41
MSKFIIIKKNKVLSYILTFLILFVLVSSTYFFVKDSASIQTITPLTSKNDTDFDLNGDGESDKFEISKESNSYILNIKIKDKNYSLVNRYGSKLLGDSLSKWPMKVDMIDLSRNNIPEVIARLSKDKTPINYVFSWNGSEFINTFVSNDNIIGILDSNNNKTPRLLSLSSSKGDESTKGFMFLGEYLKDITFSKPKVPGLSSIQGFIDIIEAPYELSEAPNIFTSNIKSTELATLWGLDKENFRYSFQNGYFTDFKWDTNGNSLGINWILSFECVKNTNDSSSVKELVLYLTVQEDGYGSLKISSIKKL